VNILATLLEPILVDVLDAGAMLEHQLPVEGLDEVPNPIDALLEPADALIHL
jgi:hypothetical protein